MRMISGLLISLGVLSSAPTAHAASPEPSNTIATAQMMVVFSAQAETGKNDAVLTAKLYKNADSSTGAKKSRLTISPDESIVFSVGSTSIHFDPSNVSLNKLPFVPDAKYTVQFRRFNGEFYSADVVIPPARPVLTPAENAVVSKTAPVDFTWAPSKADMGLVGIMVGLGCRSKGKFHWTSDTSGTLPAGFVGGCAGVVNAKFMTFPINSTPFNGISGYFSGAIASIRDFSFGAPLMSEPSEIPASTDNL
jgi:hypothetical protein